ncbi:MAG: hypothetical protein ACRDOO_04185, partial [Actinomadura sp.]
MRTRNSPRIAAAALLAVASGATLTGSANAVQATSSRTDAVTDGVAAQELPVAVPPSRPERPAASERTAVRRPKVETRGSGATAAADRKTSARADAVSYRRIP